MGYVLDLKSIVRTARGSEKGGELGRNGTPLGTWKGIGMNWRIIIGGCFSRNFQDIVDLSTLSCILIGIFNVT